MLSDSKISSLYFEALGSQHLREQDRTTVSRFALAVEAEVRAQDTALIRQMLDALKSSSPYADIAYRWKEEEWIKRRADAIASAESFLQETIQHPQPSPSSGAFLLPDEQELTHNSTGT